MIVEVTTDTKIILQIEAYLTEGHDLATSFRLALNDFEGSSRHRHGQQLRTRKVFLALREADSRLCRPLDDQYLFPRNCTDSSSDPFFIKINGEMPADPERPETTGNSSSWTTKAPAVWRESPPSFYNGTLPLNPDHIQKAEITTGHQPRQLQPLFLKEISESTQSIRKTLLASTGSVRIRRGEKYRST